jgi:hypothetical protein
MSVAQGTATIWQDEGELNGDGLWILRRELDRRAKPELVPRISCNALRQPGLIVGEEPLQVGWQRPAETSQRLLALRAERAHEEGDSKTKRERPIVSELVRDLLLVVDQQSMSMSGQCDHEGCVGVRVAMLQPVPEPDEKAEVRPHDVCRVGPPFTQTALQLSHLGFAIDLEQALLAIWIPVSVVDMVADELSVQEVEPGEVHVDDKAFEGPGLGWIVVEPDR